jgi:DNA-binding LacI/PurR family transcriptional regulator
MLVWGLRLAETYIMDLYKENKPLILVNNYLKKKKVNFVINDDEQGSFEVTEHLIKSGHKRIAYIRGIKDVSISLDREKGYKRALVKHRLKHENNFIEEGNYSMESGYQAMRILLKRHSKGFTAVVAGNDLMAIGAMRAVSEQGLKIPADLAVAGGDGISLSEYVSPALTTFKVPMYELGVRAANKLLQIIEAGKKEAVKEVLKTKLLIRQSSGGKI